VNAVETLRRNTSRTNEIATSYGASLVFPDDLLEPWSCLTSHRKWRVIFTRPGRQQALASDMLAAEVPFYLPRGIKRGRVREVSYYPLFDNYLFLFATEKECMQSLLTGRINRVLPVPEQEVFHGDLQQIDQLIRSNVPLAIERKVVPGTAVRIKSGPLKGVKGTVIERRQGTRLLVAVRFLQAGVSVEIDHTELE
jgi:hypothetical protein